MEVTLPHVMTVLVLLYVAILTYITKTEKLSWKEVMTITMGSLGAIALVITVWDRSSKQLSDIQVKRQQLAYDELSNQERNFVGLVKEIQANFPESLELYWQMFDTYTTADIPSMHTQATLAVSQDDASIVKARLVTEALSLKVFQTVENFLTIAGLIIPSTQVEWMSRLIMWFRSPILQQSYSKYKQYYSADAVSFMDQLVDQAHNLQSMIDSGAKLTPQDYHIYVSQIKFTPRL